MIVLVQDAATVRYCHRGVRAFFARHGLDWSDFVKNGIEADKLRATNDAMAMRLVKAAEARCGQGY